MRRSELGALRKKLDGMAKSKDDIKYATAQAKLSEDEALRVRYKSGTPLEGGKIAESEPVDLFSSARNISSTHTTNTTHPSTTDDQQPQRSSHDSLSLEEILMLQVKVIRV
ncbi:SEED MATURATION PROTEIN 1 [Vitis vinifera]|uniref:Uncharacterized protein n=1 Tax=Vitis vinifera TaxID=29760 RepID=A0A438BWM0_VITVI|nr:SEED MATURATION PROTEIN 1 [Vitis vinifera]RVW15353.1 hypothetical protein CK203_085615 [Vitis vinifera]RVW98347.1 hypothetical protein CK203_034307 [Vitis vinifera]|eukprot:XP_019074894.1 PREDICTED: uncharacterized protein LOC100265021 [Vitis vinifera]